MVDEEDIMLSINFDLSILTTQKGISLFGKIPFVFTPRLFLSTTALIKQLLTFLLLRKNNEIKRLLFSEGNFYKLL